MVVQDPDSDGEGAEGDDDGEDDGMFANANPLARNLISKARKAGSNAESSGASASSSAMPGRGYSLKGDNNSAAGPSSSAEEEQEITITITLWKNGFSVDDGELRDYNTPENKQLMEQLNLGTSKGVY